MVDTISKSPRFIFDNSKHPQIPMGPVMQLRKQSCNRFDFYINHIVISCMYYSQRVFIAMCLIRHTFTKYGRKRHPKIRFVFYLMTWKKGNLNFLASKWSLISLSKRRNFPLQLLWGDIHSQSHWSEPVRSNERGWTYSSTVISKRKLETKHTDINFDFEFREFEKFSGTVSGTNLKRELAVPM